MNFTTNFDPWHIVISVYLIDIYYHEVRHAVHCRLQERVTRFGNSRQRSALWITTFYCNWSQKEAGKRQKKRDRRLAQGAVESVDEGEDDLALEEADRRLLDESDLEKPEKPVLMEVAEEKARITARYQTIRRQPGMVLRSWIMNLCLNLGDCTRGGLSWRVYNYNYTVCFLKVYIRRVCPGEGGHISKGDDFILLFKSFCMCGAITLPANSLQILLS